MISVIVVAWIVTAAPERASSSFLRGLVNKPMQFFLGASMTIRLRRQEIVKAFFVHEGEFRHLADLKLLQPQHPNRAFRVLSRTSNGLRVILRFSTNSKTHRDYSCRHQGQKNNRACRSFSSTWRLLSRLSRTEVFWGTYNSSGSAGNGAATASSELKAVCNWCSVIWTGSTCHAGGAAVHETIEIVIDTSPEEEVQIAEGVSEVFS